MKSDADCEYLDWDSAFFGFRIGRAKAAHLTDKSVTEILAWCHHNLIDCLYFLADSASAETTTVAEKNNFQFVDVRVSLECSITSEAPADPTESKVRAVSERDISLLQNIARISHRDSRFYYDVNFPESLCNALYETWIEKSCHGWADYVLVGEHEGKPASYLTCHHTGTQTGQIGLLGVGEAAQGKGLGTALVKQALRWFKERGVTRIAVTTQGRNVRGQRLYQKCGFLTSEVQLWYHRWSSPRTHRSP
jgi:dTDP-4-amino-4,6-dideoxy-D-galactose acyltransferase